MLTRSFRLEHPFDFCAGDVDKFCRFVADKSLDFKSVYDGDYIITAYNGYEQLFSGYGFDDFMTLIYSYLDYVPDKITRITISPR